MLTSKRADSPNSAPSEGYKNPSMHTRTFPFFGLPREIRDIVYKLVFETPLQDNTITPDPAHKRRECSKHDEGLKQRTISNVLGLLLLCRRAHEEAVEALYSKQVFYFDDIQHGSHETKVEATAHCDFCLRGCCDSSHRHYLRVPYCDFVSMHEWLVAIGEKNRMRIRHIHLHFSGSPFAKCLGERFELFPSLPGKPPPIGGQFVVKALELLGITHNLENIEVSFGYPPLNEASGDFYEDHWSRGVRVKQAFDAFFHPKKPRNLKNALCTITGVRRLVCQDVIDAKFFDHRVTDGARAGLREVREAMESGHPSRMKPGETLAYSQAPSTGKWSNRWKVSSPWPEASMRQF